MSQLTETERNRILLETYLDPVLFLKTFLKDWFPQEVPWVHRGILAILTHQTDFLLKYGELDKITSNFLFKVDPTDPESEEKPIFTFTQGQVSMVVGKYTLIMMPRGFSKTTLINAAAIYNIVMQERKFLAYLSESGNHSETQLANIKREFEQNESLAAVFGSLVPGRQESAKWTNSQIELTNGVSAISRGRGGQIRGSNIGSQRPDLILMDDVEDEESVNTEEQREKSRKWAYEAVMPALPPLDENASIVAAGTLLHREALLMQFARDPEWTTVIFGALDRQGEPLWKEAMDEAKIERKKRSFSLAGNLSGFYREYFNTLRDESTAKFREAFLKYTPSLMPDVVFKAIAVDPAISAKKRSDYHAQAVVGMTQKGEIVILDVDGSKGLTPREQVDWYFDWCEKWGLTSADHHGVEAVAYQQALVHLIREEMFRHHMYFEVEEIRHGEKKETRVEGVLQPRYAAGYIHHLHKFPLYEQQLLDWPNDKKDLPDVVAMAITLLDPYAAAAADPSRDLGDDEYEPLNVVLGNWRSAP